MQNAIETISSEKPIPLFMHNIWIANLQKIISLLFLKFRSNPGRGFNEKNTSNEEFVSFVYFDEIRAIDNHEFKNPFLSQNHFQCFMSHKVVKKEGKIKFPLLQSRAKWEKRPSNRSFLLTEDKGGLMVGHFYTWISSRCLGEKS